MSVLRFHQLRHCNLLWNSAFHTEIISKGSFDPPPLEICLTRITHALTAFCRTFRIFVLTGLHIAVSISTALSPYSNHAAQSERDSYSDDFVLDP